MDRQFCVHFCVVVHRLTWFLCCVVVGLGFEQTGCAFCCCLDRHVAENLAGRRFPLHTCTGDRHSSACSLTCKTTACTPARTPHYYRALFWPSAAFPSSPTPAPYPTLLPYPTARILPSLPSLPTFPTSPTTHTIFGFLYCLNWLFLCMCTFCCTSLASCMHACCLHACHGMGIGTFQTGKGGLA